MYKTPQSWKDKDMLKNSELLFLFL